MKSTSLRAGVGAVVLALVTAVTFAVAPASGAVSVYDLTINPVGGAYIQNGELQMVAQLDTPCDEVPTASQVTFSYDGVEIDTIVPFIVDAANFAFVVPASLMTTPAALLFVRLDCEIESVDSFGENNVEWAQIDVTKVVVGDAPVGAEFTVNVECMAEPILSVGSLETADVPEPYSFNLQLTAGATGSVMALIPAECAIAETENAGALSSVVSVPLVVIDDIGIIPVTVTNTFAAATPKFTG